ncbi:MAG: hypothetical protein ACK55X_12170 [Synechococcaceae cyanobacterium]
MDEFGEYEQVVSQAKTVSGCWNPEPLRFETLRTGMALGSGLQAMTDRPTRAILWIRTKKRPSQNGIQ